MADPRQGMLFSDDGGTNNAAPRSSTADGVKNKKGKSKGKSSKRYPGVRRGTQDYKKYLTTKAGRSALPGALLRKAGPLGLIASAYYTGQNMFGETERDQARIFNQLQEEMLMEDVLRRSSPLVEMENMIREMELLANQQRRIDNPAPFLRAQAESGLNQLAIEDLLASGGFD